jgi:uncharacterized GH25 family protein
MKAHISKISMILLFIFIELTGCNDTTNVKAPKLNLKIVPETPLQVKVGESTNYYLTVTDDKEKPVPDATIIVTDGLVNVTMQIQKLTDVNGNVGYYITLAKAKQNEIYTFSFYAKKNQYEQSDVVVRQILAL